MARGLFRIWIVLTGCWMAFCAAVASNSEVFWDRFPTVVLAPALVILATGAALIWAVRGFQR